MAGFEHVRGDIVITLDADLQNPPEEITPNIVAKMDEGHDSSRNIQERKSYDLSSEKWHPKWSTGSPI